MDIQRLEFGIDTFGDVTAGPDGALLPHDQVIRNLIDEAVLADEVGLDAIGVGTPLAAGVAFAVSTGLRLAAIQWNLSLPPYRG